MEAYDPLADVPPPRYAVESDDEDEYNPSFGLPSRSEQGTAEVNVEFKSTYDIPPNRPLIFASGEAGANWAQIVHLGQQVGEICVDNFPVGLLFLPYWTNAVVVVSEAESTRLPLYAMTIYTTAIINCLQPTSVVILDSYATKLYISPRAISQDSAPIRYLSVGEKSIPDIELELFAPPNLLQATAASLLNVVFLRLISESSLAARYATAIILLPSYRVTPPPPTSFNGRSADFADPHWSRGLLAKAHRWLFAIFGEEVDVSSLRTGDESTRRPLGLSGITRSALGSVGEGGMYI